MNLHDRLDRAIRDVLDEDPTIHEALAEGADEGRGDAAHALQDLQRARNALLDAASRWDRAHG